MEIPHSQTHVWTRGVVVWIDLIVPPSLSAGDSMSGVFEFVTVRKPHHIARVIGHYAPPFICVEIEGGDDAHQKSIEMLKRVREVDSDMPLLIVAGNCTALVGRWAAGLSICKVMVKPVSGPDPFRAIGAIASKLQVRESSDARRVPADKLDPHPVTMRTAPALSYVANHYADKILLGNVAAECRLSSSQFCRTFKKEHQLSFGRYLLRFRMDRARERLSLPGVLVKDVAYEVGFNDLSYFTRSFRREFGLCPSVYQAGATPTRASRLAA